MRKKFDPAKFSWSVIGIYAVVVITVISLWYHYFKTEIWILISIFAALYIYCFYLIRKTFKQHINHKK